MAGRRIDDHSAWMGARGKSTVLPDGAKTKQVESADGVGELSHYEDTNEEIVKGQRIAAKKVRSLPRKENFRN